MTTKVRHFYHSKYFQTGNSLSWHFPNKSIPLWFFYYILTGPQNFQDQATEFGGNDRTITPSFSYLLNKVNDPSLPYFHYSFPMFHNCFCLILVLVSLQNYSSLFVVRSLSTNRHHYPNKTNKNPLTIILTEQNFVARKMLV